MRAVNLIVNTPAQLGEILSSARCRSGPTAFGSASGASGARGDGAAYDPAWKQSAAGRPLSLSLPFGIGDAPLRGERVNRYFDNLLPDSEAIRRRLATRFGTTTLEPFDLLAAVGRDCVGAVQLLGEDEAPAGFDRIDGTPLYDVMSIWPVEGDGANQWSWHKAKLATAVHGKRRHYAMREVTRRHFSAMAEQCRLGDIATPIVERLIAATPGVIDAVGAALPRGFPAKVADRILAGLKQAAQRLDAMPAA